MITTHNRSVGPRPRWLVVVRRIHCAERVVPNMLWAVCHLAAYSRRNPNLPMQGSPIESWQPVWKQACIQESCWRRSRR